MKCCHETQGGRFVGDTHGFTLPTTFMRHLLCARHPAGPRGPEVGVTSSCPVRTQIAGLGNRCAHQHGIVKPSVHRRRKAL